LKVLFAPSNIASFSSALSSRINQYEHVCAKGISIGGNKYVTYTSEWTVVQYVSWKKNPIKRLLQMLYVTYKMIALILWADIIYWQSSMTGLTIGDLHFKLIRLLQKPLFVEWVGSDVRKPGWVSLHNRFYKRAWDSGQYEYKMESDAGSQQRQKIFKKLNAIPIVSPEISLFVDRSIFPKIEIINARVDLREFSVNTSANKTCLIVHAPSAVDAKGTKYVRSTIKKLQEKNLPFEYREVTNVPRKEALRNIREADIYLDQFIVGSYGMAACEAMAFGKVVVCYLMKPVADLLPGRCPIVNASLDDIENKLQELILKPELRNSIAQQSRAYVEQYHDAEKIAQQVYTLFRRESVNREKTNQAISL
jgi:hypothetical protein